MKHTHRVTAVVAGLAGLALAACTGTPPTVTPVVGTPNPLASPSAVSNAKPLTIKVLNTELAPGEERVTFRLKAPDGTDITDGTANVGVYRILSGSGQAAKSASGPAAFFGSGQTGGGEWVVYSEFDSSGPWGFEVSLDHPTYGPAVGRVNIEVAARPRTPKVGDHVPSPDSPTAAAGDLATITSDPSPDPGLYTMTVGDAAASGKPTVIYFGSPAHCSTQLCADSLAALKQVKGQFGSQVNFIHVETRDLKDPAQLSPTTAAWGLPSEPWTFVLDKAGRVNTRMEGGLDPLELQAVLQQKLGVQ
jgi:hypothetical protein